MNRKHGAIRLMLFLLLLPLIVRLEGEGGQKSLTLKTGSLTSTVIENFDDGEIQLLSYPGQDLQPNGWSLDSITTHNNSPRSLKLTGNTWKLEMVIPTLLDSGDVWQVAAYVEALGEIQGFGLVDSTHSLLFSLFGTEEVDINEWVTVYQGAFAQGTWNVFQLAVGREWLARFGYLPTITGIVFINDRDTDPAAIVCFDDVIDITQDMPIAPRVEIGYSAGKIYKNVDRQRSVDVQFFSTVTDPDSGTHSYRWSFGDDSTSTQPNPAHTYVIEDDHEYNVLLEVADQTGMWGYASCQVNVDPGQTSYPITLNFVGDIMMARRYEAAGGIIPTQGVQAIYAPTRSILGDAADITVANLECSLTQSGTPHPTKPIIFRSSPANAAGLVYAGIDVVTIANNHILDYGLDGLLETQNVLTQNAICFSGAGANAYRAYLPEFYSKSGVTFAFLALSDRTGQYNNYQPYLSAGQNKPGFANLTQYELRQQISGVRDDADLVVVEMHSGTEYSTAPDRQSGRFTMHPDGADDEDYSPELRMPTETDREIRKDAIDAGADIVICHHPHIIHGFETYHGKLIAHSLGNFVFDLDYAETQPSMILNAKVDATGFREFTVTPVYIDDYIPRHAEGQLGLHILDYLAMRSRDLGTYLIVQPESVRATIVLDSTILWPRSSTTQRTVALTQSGGWSVSKPERLARNGSIASIPSIAPQGAWQYRLGREVVWFGNCENEGCSLWFLDASDERFDTTVAHSGRRSLQHRRSSGSSTLTTNCQSRPMPSTVAPAFSIYGWIKTSNARDVTMRAKLYSTRSGSEIGSGDIGALVTGTSDWSFYSNEIVAPSDVNYVDVVLESKAPSSGTGYAWFDDVGLVEWTDWKTYDGTGQCAYPNDIYWLQVRTSSLFESATLSYREVSFVNVSQPSSVAVNVESGWNLISNPVTQPDSLKTVRSIFPRSEFEYAFRFVPGLGYVQSSTLENGSGYWGKFPYSETNTITGATVLHDSIRVSPGWNLIGSITTTVDTAAVYTVPPGLKASVFYGYSHGYFPATGIAPGSAYWVKSNDSGMFILRAGLSRLTRGDALPGDVSSLTVTGSDGETRQVYFGGKTWLPVSMSEAPPPPPAGVMDVRFESDRFHVTADTVGSHEWAIRISSASYPVRLSWSISSGAASLRVDNRIRSMEGSGSMTVPDPASRVSLMVSNVTDVPHEFTLGQNYPNPFNPVTTISYSLPTVSAVSLKVFDITGQLVRMLCNGDQKPGRHSILWDGTNEKGENVGSGVYFYQLQAGPFVRTKKLLMLR